MDKPPDVASSPRLLLPIFLIGRDSKGNWVVQEQNGARGGLFVDRERALKFATSENGNHPPAIVWVNGALELNASAEPAAPPKERSADDAQRARRVA
jgi:hypothetical protein